MERSVELLSVFGRESNEADEEEELGEPLRVVAASAAAAAAAAAAGAAAANPKTECLFFYYYRPCFLAAMNEYQPDQMFHIFVA